MTPGRDRLAYSQDVRCLLGSLYRQYRVGPGRHRRAGHNAHGVASVKTDAADLLRAHGIQPSAQRIVIARYVLFTDEHPSADKVLARVRAGFPMISRATVYNTLNLFVEKGLLREQHLAPDSIVFDPRTDAHHHFVDEASGRIYDVDWGKVRVSNVESIDGFEVHDYQVVMRGRKKGPAKR